MSYSRSNDSNTPIKGTRKHIDTFATLRDRQIAPQNEQIFQTNPELANRIHEDLANFLAI